MEPRKFVITVEGGVVTGLFSNQQYKGERVEICDHDHQDEDAEIICKGLIEQVEKMKQIW